jgi:hypothetical protein
VSIWEDLSALLYGVKKIAEARAETRTMIATIIIEIDFMRRKWYIFH